jgi:hypothetical protein
MVLVKFVRVPVYGFPVAGDQDPEDLGIPLDRQDIYMEDVIIDGPATYNGLCG